MARRRSAAFGLLVAAVGLFGPAAALLLLLAGGPDAAAGALPAAVLSAAVLLAAVLVQRRPASRVRVLLLAGLLGLAVAVFYAATGAVIRGLDPSWADARLWRADGVLLGWLLPEGAPSLWIDRSALLGPHTLPGRVLTEALQLVYTTYYLWGFGLLLLLAVRFAKDAGAAARRHLSMFLRAWVGAYLVNYVLYVLVPAIGPYVFFADRYEHALDGLWATPFLRDTIAAHQVVPDCFPSGHTALSWITAIAALRLAPRYGRWATLAAVLITLSTVPLRYHYVVDLVAAVPLIVLGLLWGGFLRRRVPERGA